jgi:retron-type reverse transcriptase
MYAAEKSDINIVPKKAPNKGGQPQPVCGGTGGKDDDQGESLERTTVTCTQRQAKASSGLERIRQAAGRDKNLRFTSLMHHISKDLLREAYKSLKRNAAPGIDNETWQAYGEQLEQRLPKLHERVQSGRYRAKPSKRVWLPKPDGRKRPIGITALEDKIVQQAVVWVIIQIYEKDFLGISYGFRPGRSQHNALDAVYVGITRRANGSNLRLTFDGQCILMVHSQRS